MDDTLVGFGGAIKALGDNKIGGYLVVFSDSSTPDLAGDFFTADTDFGPATQTMTWYDHKMDSSVRYSLDSNATLKKDAVGIWCEAQLSMRNAYEQKIMEMVQAGKLGWSSGTAAHLVEREASGKAYWIKQWPLGLDASITPTPCEPRTSVVPLKSLQTSVEPPVGLTLDDHTSNVLDATEALVTRLEELKSMRDAQGRRLGQKRLDELKTLASRIATIIDFTTRPTESEILSARLALLKL